MVQKTPKTPDRYIAGDLHVQNINASVESVVKYLESRVVKTVKLNTILIV